MERIQGARQAYAWGSRTAIPEFLGVHPDPEPWAEQWYGAHSRADSYLESGVSLRELIHADPQSVLGADLLPRFGAHLPYLLKIIAPAQALSLQVHPSLAQARRGFALENQQGVALDAASRNYKDANHKPEMVWALTRFDAVAGFRAPRRAAEILANLDSPLAQAIRRTLRLNPTRAGIRQVFTDLVHESTRPAVPEVNRLVKELAARLQSGRSPSVRVDKNALTMAQAFPGDPGIVAALLLNPVTLQVGEALFVPAGCVHAYISGLGVEIMANSDNVLRAGLTAKHIDTEEMLACVDYVAAPPVRPAPEHLSACVRAYYAPVDDFELLVVSVNNADGQIRVPGRGPRILLAITGKTTASTRHKSLTLARGQALFVKASETDLYLEGRGTVIQADVP